MGLLILALLAFVSCSRDFDNPNLGGPDVVSPVDGAGNPVKPSVLSAVDMRLTVGETKAPQIAFQPPDAVSKEYQLNTSDPKVAAIRSEGIKGAGAGSAIITVTTPDHTLRTEFKVTVIRPAARVESIEAEDMAFALLNLLQPSRRKPALIWKPSDASDKAYTLTSSDARVAKPDGEWIQAVGTGEARVTAVTHDGARRTTFDVRVSLLDSCAPDGCEEEKVAGAAKDKGKGRDG
jgi:hypothetical protein